MKSASKPNYGLNGDGRLVYMGMHSTTSHQTGCIGVNSVKYLRIFSNKRNRGWSNEKAAGPWSPFSRFAVRPRHKSPCERDWRLLQSASFLDHKSKCSPAKNAKHSERVAWICGAATIPSDATSANERGGEKRSRGPAVAPLDLKVFLWTWEEEILQSFRWSSPNRPPLPLQTSHSPKLTPTGGFLFENRQTKFDQKERERGKKGKKAKKREEKKKKVDWFLQICLFGCEFLIKMNKTSGNTWQLTITHLKRCWYGQRRTNGVQNRPTKKKKKENLRTPIG